MSKHRHSIVSLHEAGERQCDFARVLKIAKQTVSKTIQQHKELGHEIDRPSVRTSHGKPSKREFYGIRRDQ